MNITERGGEKIRKLEYTNPIPIEKKLDFVGWMMDDE